MRLIPFLVSLALLLSSTGRSEDIENPYRQNRFGNLHFYVPAGNSTAEFGFIPTLTDNATITNVSASSAETLNTNSTEIGLTSSFGIIDGLRLSVAETAYYRQTTTTDLTTNLAGSSYTTGFSNPDLTLVYRLVENQNQGLHVDASFEYAPQVGSDSTTTSELAGRADAYYELGIHEFRAELAALFALSGTVNSGVSTRHYDSYTILDAALTYRLHLTESFFGEVGAAFNFGRSVNSSFPNQTPVVTQTTSVPFYITPMVEVGYLVTPKILLTALFSYSDRQDSFVNTAAAATNYTETQSITTVALYGTFLF